MPLHHFYRQGIAPCTEDNRQPAAHAACGAYIVCFGIGSTDMRMFSAFINQLCYGKSCCGSHGDVINVGL